MSLDSIRVRDEGYHPTVLISGYDIVCEDRRALLAEVDRLEAALFVSEERVARIREAVVELEGEYAGKVLYPTLIRRSKVLDIIEGVTP